MSEKRPMKHKKEELKHMIEVEQLRQWEAAERLGVKVRTVEYWCKKLGLRTQRTGPRSGEKHTGWKGGRTLISGYWHIYMPEHPYAVHNKNYVAEHRLIMEHILGRYLDPKEVVHHKNKDKQDNSPDNLALYESNAAHLKHELTGRIPKWSDEGWEKVQSYNRNREVIQDAWHARQRKYSQDQRNRLKESKFCGPPTPQSTDHQTL